jgi:diguanylate cyclase (GGDEF)-like protein
MRKEYRKKSSNFPPSLSRKFPSSVRRAIMIDKSVTNPSFSPGIAVYPEHGVTPDELFKNADAALYKAKNMGKNRYLFFEHNQL